MTKLQWHAGSAALATTILLATAPATVAQPANDPIVSAYTEFKAAEARGDLAAAEPAAALALAASEARDGDGGATAILASNLATVRMELNRPRDALEPARRALALARKGAKGVDELTLTLMIGEIELTLTPTGDESALLAALAEADKRGADIDSGAYDAAVALAKAANKTAHYANEQTAWRSAQRHIDGVSGDTRLALAAAIQGEALSTVALGHAREGYNLLVKVVDMLVPLAPESDDATLVSPAELQYADALAWAIAVRTTNKAALDQQWAPLSRQRPGVLGRPPLCPGSVTAEPLPDYPSHLIGWLSYGAGEVQLQTDPSGKVLSAAVLAAVPTAEFRVAMMDPKIHWNYQPLQSAAGCRNDSKDRLITVVFTFPPAP